MNKRSALALSVFGVLLLGCASAMTPAQLYKAGKPFHFAFYKAGGTQAELKNDQLNCQIEATQRVPQNMQIRTTPTYTTPVTTTCNQIGYSTYCNSSGGDTYGGKAYSVDENSGLRQQASLQCMARLGYRSYDIPPCPKGVTPNQLKSIPVGKGAQRITPRTCYIATDEGQTYGDL